MNCFKLLYYFLNKLKIFVLLFIFGTTIQTYSCFDCCTHDSAYIKPSYTEKTDKKKEQLPSTTQTDEIIEKKEAFTQADHPIQLQTETKTIITSPDENNEQQQESAPHFIEENSNTKKKFYNSPFPEKPLFSNFNNISPIQTTSTNSMQLGNDRSYDSAQIAFNNTHNLDPAEQAVIFSKRILSSSQNSFYSSSNYKNLEKNTGYQKNDANTPPSAAAADNDDNNNDDDQTAQNSRPSTIDSMVANAGWPTAIFQSDSNSINDKVSQRPKSCSGVIYPISPSEH